MLLNNDVHMNNVMILWGELNVLMKKCNYQSKEQYSPMKKFNMVSELHWSKVMEITPMMTPLMEARRRWWRPKIILGFEEILR